LHVLPDLVAVIAKKYLTVCSIGIACQTKAKLDCLRPQKKTLFWIINFHRAYFMQHSVVFYRLRVSNCLNVGPFISNTRNCSTV